MRWWILFGGNQQGDRSDAVGLTGLLAAGFPRLANGPHLAGFFISYASSVDFVVLRLVCGYTAKHEITGPKMNASINFQAWLKQADMPTQEGNGWVDLEDGIAYNPEWDYVGNKPRAPRTELSAKAQDARAVAKFFGGKALTGTAKQKEWAEKIRASVLGWLTQDQAELVCDPASLCRTASFWINNRNRRPAEFPEFVEAYRALARRCESHRAAGNQSALTADVAKYNALTAVWGFGD